MDDFKVLEIRGAENYHFSAALYETHSYFAAPWGKPHTPNMARGYSYTDVITIALYKEDRTQFDC